MNLCWPEYVQRINGKKRSDLLCRKLKGYICRRRLEHKELHKDIRQNNLHVRDSHYMVWNNRLSSSLHMRASETTVRNKNVPKMIKWRVMITDSNKGTDNCRSLVSKHNFQYSAGRECCYETPRCLFQCWGVLSLSFLVQGLVSAHNPRPNPLLRRAAFPKSCPILGQPTSSGCWLGDTKACLSYLDSRHPEGPSQVDRSPVGLWVASIIPASCSRSLYPIILLPSCSNRCCSWAVPSVNLLQASLHFSPLPQETNLRHTHLMPTPSGGTNMINIHLFPAFLSPTLLKRSQTLPVRILPVPQPSAWQSLDRKVMGSRVELWWGDPREALANKETIQGWVGILKNTIGSTQPFHGIQAKEEKSLDSSEVNFCDWPILCLMTVVKIFKLFLWI